MLQTLTFFATLSRVFFIPIAEFPLHISNKQIYTFLLQHFV